MPCAAESQPSVPGTSPSLLYAAFESYPGNKGAQTHIRNILSGAAPLFPERTLITLGRGSARKDTETGATHLPVVVEEPNFLLRSEIYGRKLAAIADGFLSTPPAVIHFRDIWSGIPFLSHPISRKAPVIFEVNGFPSIELPAHYPGLATNRPLICRLRAMEDHCLARAARLVAVCETGAQYLRERGVEERKIHVIPNAAPSALHNKPVEGDRAFPPDAEVLAYVGTLAPWQGIETLLRALSHLRHREELRLLVVTPGKKWLRSMKSAAKRLGVWERIEVRVAQPHHAVGSIIAGASLTVAPLARGSRNELQGCSPLKVIESMACGIPVVAADLPIVRELVRHGEEGWLVPPDSPRALAAGIERVLEDGALRRILSAGARRAAAGRFCLSVSPAVWKRCTERLWRRDDGQDRGRQQAVPHQGSP